MSKRPAMLRGLTALTLLSLVGCMNKPLRLVEPDGTYCFRVSKSRHQTCTVEAVPSVDAEHRAKRFLPSADAVTVYVVRHRWADAANQVAFKVDAGPSVLTIPESVVALRLRPGSHRLSLTWDGVEVDHVIEGKAGDVQFVQLVGSVLAWRSSYRWETGRDDDTRQLALKAKLIADIRVQ